MAKEVVNPFDELTFQEIYDGIESQGYIERTHKNIISQLKNTTSYKSIMEIAERNIYNTNFNTPDVQNQEKKIPDGGSAMGAADKKSPKELIGILASEYDYSISNAISKTMGYDAKFTVETYIKRLSTLKQCKASKMSSPTKKEYKKPANNSSEKTKMCTNSKRNSETFRKRLDDSDDETDSSGSVSSVHTSELSSFDDEIVLPVEDKANRKKETRLSFKAVNQAYKSMVSRKKIYPKQRSSIQKSSKAATSGAVTTDDHKKLSKRTPKPNSRYSMNN